MRKSTYPPPADGLCVPFLCKRLVGASEAPAQVRCGVCGMFRNCTECKALQKSAVALHMRKGAAGEGALRRGARFTGAMVMKTCCRRCFRFRNRSYQGPTSCCRALRKNDCEAQPVRGSGILRHCTASPSISGCQYPSRACGKNAKKVSAWLFFRRGVGKR